MNESGYNFFMTVFQKLEFIGFNFPLLLFTPSFPFIDENTNKVRGMEAVCLPV